MCIFLLRLLYRKIESQSKPKKNTPIYAYLYYVVKVNHVKAQAGVEKIFLAPFNILEINLATNFGVANNNTHSHTVKRQKQNYTENSISYSITST